MGLSLRAGEKRYKLTYLPTHPLLTKDGVLMEPLFEKTDDFLQLTLDFVVIVLEPFGGRVVGVVELDLKDVCAVMNPKGVDNTELVAYVVDKLVLSLTDTGVS
jgi:hypothetical protein